MSHTLRELLVEHRDDIIARFVAAVQSKDISPPGLTRSILVNQLPQFLDETLNELGEGRTLRYSQDALDESHTAKLHGEQRWEVGYDLEALMREYGILRHAVLEAAKAAQVEVSLDDLDVFTKCINVGVSSAVQSYVRYRDEQLNLQKANLEFLVEAGEVLSSSLDYRSTLSHLTRLLVPRLADWCAIHLDGSTPDDMPIAHADAAKVELVRAIFRRYPLPADSQWGYPYVQRTGQSQLVESVSPELLQRAARSPEHLSLLQAVNACSWIIVPLSVQGKMFGALTLAHSDSRRRYSQADLLLATELARRAATAIDNARLYEQSQRERSRVEAATRAKDEFVAMVSHELRTPLNAILGWVRLLRNGSLPGEKSAHALEIIERNAVAQNRLVNDLLDISRAITGKIRISPAQVDLCDIVEMTLEDARLALEAKRLRLHVSLDRDTSTLRGDGDRLRQVVWNLLTNAIKFTPKNGDIWIDLRRVESDIEFRVRDSGTGIRPDFLAHVFESFRQSDSSTTRVHGGLGVGLSIAKHLVDLHGGSIQAESDGPGHGATFTVRLPISPVISTTLGVRSVRTNNEAAALSNLSNGLDGVRALVVDDEPDARELISFVLQSCNIAVLAVASAADALKELDGFLPHVIISDIGMAEQDGYSLIRNIRSQANPETRNTPAIALTAFARNEDRTRALVAGFNLHLPKPVEPSVLVQAVVDLVKHPQ